MTQQCALFGDGTSHSPLPLLVCGTGVSSLTHDRLLAAVEELQDLKGVWSELSKIWQKIDELKEKPWMAVAPRKVRTELDSLLELMKGMPSHLKSYASYDFVQRMIKGYLKVSVCSASYGYLGSEHIVFVGC